MSAIRQTNSKTLMLFSGRAYPELAEAVAAELGIDLTVDAGQGLRQR